MGPERRAAILDAVGAWLDMHPDEPLPVGVDPALADDPTPPPDLAAVVAAVLACRHDVKLQTRAFRRLEERLEATQRELEQARAVVARDADPAAALLELFDRLRRGSLACVEAGRHIPLLSARGAVRRRIDGIAAGVALTMERASELLAFHRLRAFEPTGAAFDAARMRAVGRGAATPQTPAGHVLETVRAGVERDGEVVRPAEVLVARESDGDREVTR